MPCVECGYLLPLQSIGCEKCGQQEPFACSRCEAKVTLAQVYQPAQLTSWKPLYCNDCGDRMQIVECHHCRIRLLQDVGLWRLNRRGIRRVYHPDCMSTYRLQRRVALTVRSASMPILAALAGWMAWSNFHDVPMVTFHVLCGAAAGFLASLLFEPQD